MIPVTFLVLRITDPARTLTKDFLEIEIGAVFSDPKRGDCVLRALFKLRDSPN